MAIIIQMHQEVYGNTIETNQFWLMTDAGAVANFSAANNNKNALFKLKQKITDKTADGGTKNVALCGATKIFQ